MSLEPESKGLPLELDPEAASADSTLPGFLARPEGAPVYHGFRLIDDIEFEGFKLGAITSFELGVNWGDAFIEGPDGSRAGLVWELSAEPVLREVMPFDENRWGVWEISFPCGYGSSNDALRVLSDIVPRLRPHWDEWRESRIHG
jgi:hypothetical protein